MCVYMINGCNEQLTDAMLVYACVAGAALLAISFLTIGRSAEGNLFGFVPTQRTSYVMLFVAQTPVMAIFLWLIGTYGFRVVWHNMNIWRNDPDSHVLGWIVWLLMLSVLASPLVTFVGWFYVYFAYAPLAKSVGYCAHPAHSGKVYLSTERLRYGSRSLLVAERVPGTDAMMYVPVGEDLLVCKPRD